MTQKNKLLKLTSIVLVVIMVVLCAPISVLAVDDSENTESEADQAQSTQIPSFDPEDYESEEFETVREWAGEDLIRTLNGVLPPGTEVTCCGRLPEVGRKSLASLIEAADYEITLEVPMGEMLAERAELFFTQENILVEKKRKKDKNPTMVDIKPMILTLDAKEEDCVLTLNVRLKTGSNANLNPELLVTAFLNFANIPFRRENLQIRRKELYYLEEEAYKPLTGYFL